MFSLHVDTARTWRGGQNQVLVTVLGLQVVAEDYVHSRLAKTIVVALIQFAGFALATAGILAVLRIAFTG